MEGPAKNPCELVIWYVIPDLRSELAKILINDFNLKQKDVAGLFGVTPAAVNQYMSSKRGGALISILERKNKKLRNEFFRQLKTAAGNIFQNNSPVDFEMCRLCHFIMDRKLLDEVYKRFEHGNIPQVLLEYHKQNLLKKSNKPGSCIECDFVLEHHWIACPNCGKRI